MSDWDEIKRLAADFQKIQLSSTLQKLSEPNCIEVVNLLVEKGLINVIFTIDGKEYITPEHFQREVEDELYAHGGRINLVALAKTLNVDLSRVNLVAEQLANDREDVHFVLGQLLTEDYLKQIAAEINDCLAQKGEVSVFELASNQFDLPTEFLKHEVMEKYLGTIIMARQDQEDNSKFFTAKYIARSKARLRGALLGLTLPTPVSTFFQQIGAQDAMYHQLINELAPRGVVTSRQKGALYVPTVYTKTQSDWVESFYKQNGYLEYDAVSRLGVTAPQNFIKRQLANESCTFLSKCCVDKRIISQVESALDECVATGSYLDATTILPSVMVEEDVADILAVIMKPNKQRTTQLFGTTILTTQFIDDLVQPCTDLANAKAQQSVDSGEYQKHLVDTQLGTGGRSGVSSQDVDNDTKSDRKDDRRRKATGGKGGGGTQGRETKTKSTKKHSRGGDKNRQFDSDDEEPVVVKRKGGAASSLELISLSEIQKAITGKLDAEGLDYLVEPLSEHFYPQVSKIAMATAQTRYEASLQNSNQNRRQAHAAIELSLNNLLGDIRLYEKGLKLLPIAQQPTLIKYLLKTLATDVSNDLHKFIAAESNLNVADTEILSAEQRAKIGQECAADYKAPLASLNKTLTGTSIDEFVTSAESLMQICGIIVKKIDKKKDRSMIMVHKHSLLEKLTTSADAALTLHLAVLAIFTISQQNIVHASGKHVTAILGFLQPFLTTEESVTLRQYHDLVLKQLSSSPDSDDDTAAVLRQLDDLTPKVKEIAMSYKKSTSGGAAD